MKLSCSAKKKQPPPDPSPEAGLAGGLAGGLEAGVEASRRASRHREANPPKPSKPSTPFKTLQTPSPTGTPGPRPLLNQAPQGQGHSNGFLLAFKAADCQPANTQTLQNPPNTPNTIQNPPNPPGLEACFEQVAQGLGLVRRVHRRSKTISLPGRLELPTLRLTASRSNQLSYGSLCRRPNLCLCWRRG